MATKAKQNDNSTFDKKVALRRIMLESVERPVVIETHGGAGKVWAACYRRLEAGAVFETNAPKAEYLAVQRPTWAVYQSDCVAALAGGAGAHLAANVLDCDPYGECWPVIEAFLTSDRPKPSPLFVVVNDGLRQSLRVTGGWDVESLRPMVMKYGNGLFLRYLPICEEMMNLKAGEAGYKVARFAGYYCGSQSNNVHFLARLERLG